MSFWRFLVFITALFSFVGLGGFSQAKTPEKPHDSVSGFNNGSSSGPEDVVAEIKKLRAVRDKLIKSGGDSDEIQAVNGEITELRESLTKEKNFISSAAKPEASSGSTVPPSKE